MTKAMKFFVGVAMVALTIVTSACQTLGGMNQTIGSLIGAGTGGFLGSMIGGRGTQGQLIGVAAGALGGALLGGSIGASMDRSDRLAAEQATQRAFFAPIGAEPVIYGGRNTQTVAVPVAEGRATDGRVCRKVHSHTFFNGGSGAKANEKMVVETTACQEKDGTWRLVPNK